MNLEAVNSIQTTIADYRNGEIPPLTNEHIIRWIKQFDSNIQDELLQEIAHVLDNSYLSKSDVHNFLKDLIRNPKLSGDNPCEFWGDAILLDIQQRGGSQKDYITLFQQALQEECGFHATIGKSGSTTFIYLDDAIFTGNHVRRDLEAWVNSKAPQKADVHVIAAAIHSGSWFQQNELEKAIRSSDKKINVHWWRSVTVEDLKKKINQSDVLRPRRLPDDKDVEAYASSLSYPITFRSKDSVGVNEVYSSEAGRNLIEQQMLIKGTFIRKVCTNLPETQRPLGYSPLVGLGFGSTIVTFRNCPNNCPLAFWVGDPWYPLFPRKTNSQSAHSAMFGGF